MSHANYIHITSLTGHELARKLDAPFLDPQTVQQLSYLPQIIHLHRTMHSATAIFQRLLSSTRNHPLNLPIQSVITQQLKIPSQNSSFSINTFPFTLQVEHENCIRPALPAQRPSHYQGSPRESSPVICIAATTPERSISNVSSATGQREIGFRFA